MRKIAQNRSIVLFFMLSILLIQLTGTFMSQDVYADEKTIILFDQVHLQFYTSERMQSAITSLNNTEDFIVYFNDQRFTETSLLGVDILVIENPERSFSLQERLVLVEYLDNGGNIFLLADPRGTISNLNNIIDAVQYTDGRFSQHVIFDEEFNQNNISTQISVSREELRESSPLTNGVKEIITHSISIEDDDPNKVIATGSNYSLAGLEGKSQPAWLVASTVGRSRIVLCGSTRMFSDVKPSKSEVTWYQTKDNARLWQNIFSWLAQKEIPPSFLGTTLPPPLTLIISAFIAGIVFIGGGFSLYYLLQQKELKPVSEILRRKKKAEKLEPTPEEEIAQIEGEKAISIDDEEIITEEKPAPPKKKKKRKKRTYRVRR
ncbi:hypothetical protein [Candidatus Borrarchaeum sp.]|uniref:hypothetical protein n=1 Tax=Candidatus Borrarchaeum sp. TaxID=2846742 RepID=UPI00258111E8|nr:hypothetical protein [Candidatus Borrarchaeum sp.]